MNISAIFPSVNSAADQGERSVSKAKSEEDFAAALERERQEAAPSSAAETKAEASFIRGNLKQTFMDGAAADGVITMDEMIAFRDKHAKEAKDILNSTMSNLGINRSAKLTIDSDAYGHITVSGTNISEEDRARLEQALDSSESFQHSFKAAAGTSCFIEAAKYHEEFSKAYEKNAKEAVARYAWLFGANWHCKMSYDNGAMDFSVGILPKEAAASIS